MASVRLTSPTSADGGSACGQAWSRLTNDTFGHTDPSTALAGQTDRFVPHDESNPILRA
jgi:hypothetical protein